MWLILAFISAALLGCYDSCKKKALLTNTVANVLFLNTLFSSLLFLPFIVVSACFHGLDQSIFYVPTADWQVHKYILFKSLLVLSSWALGYMGMQHLPLTIVGPINATRPVLVLMGAMFVFGEQLNLYQWIGVILAIISFLLLSVSGKREGIDFRRNRWIVAIVGAAMLGALSALYDKFLMAPAAEGGMGMNRMIVQSWFNIYQCFMMGGVVLLLSKKTNKRQTTAAGGGLHAVRSLPFILLISVFLCVADFVYFYALSLDDAMISIVSMIRRGSVIVSFLFGALFLHEKNLWNKSADLLLVLLGMIFLYIGSH